MWQRFQLALGKQCLASVDRGHAVGRKTSVRRFGWRPLREEGLRLVEEERSTLEEVLRVTHAETEDRTRAERDADVVGAGGR